MDDSDLLAFTPVPLRGRRDGWTPARQHTFIKALSQGYRTGRAAQRVGMSRQTAYALRQRPGAESFAAAWNAAVDAAACRRSASRAPSEWERAVEGRLRPVRYRRRVVAMERHYDNGALIRLLGRIERLLEKRGLAEDDYFLARMVNFCQLPRAAGPGSSRR
jgi:hypothetical protein